MASKIQMKNLHQRRICRHCSYDANSVNATHCEVCNYPLRSASTATRKSSAAASWSLISFGGILLVTAGFLFWLLRNNFAFSEDPTSRELLIPKNPARPQPSPTQSQPVAQQPAATAQPQPTAIASDLAVGGIHLYNSMQEVQNVPQGLFNFGGATPFAALRSQGIVDTIAKAHPKFRLRYTEPLNNKPSAGTGVKMLLNSDLSFAENSRPLKEAEYNQAKLRGFTLQQVPIGLDGIVFFVHRSIPVAGLSINQIQDIIVGKITNWKQVGGPNLPVVPFTFDPKVGSSTLNILLEGREGEKLSRNLKIIRDYTDALRQVAATPGGISYGSAATVVGQRSVRPLSLARVNSKKYIAPFTNGQINEKAFLEGDYPLIRRLFVTIRRDKTPDEKAGIAYANLLLSLEGQQIIQKAGFIPLR